MKHFTDIVDELRELNPDAILWDGFESALVGAGQRCGQPALAVYSIEKMIEICVTRDGMTEEDAVEYLDFNVLGGWLGEHTPIAVG